MDYRKLATEDENGNLYIDTGTKIRLFRQKHPEARFETEVIKLQPNFAVVKAAVKNGDGVLAEAFSGRVCTADCQRFLETAETVAIGRALTDLGYEVPSFELETGCDPLSKQIVLDDGSPYLEVAYRLAWFRKENPDAVIKKELLYLDGNSAMMKVSVVNGMRILATAHARRLYDTSTEIGVYFVDNAETAAMGRALSILGYDLQQSVELSGITNGPKESALLPPASPMEFQAKDAPADASVLPPPIGFQTQDAPDGEENRQMTFSFPDAAGFPEFPEFPDFPENKVTFEEAVNMVVPFGEHQGETFGDIIRSGDFKCLEHIASGNEPKYSDAARIILARTN